MSAAAPATMIGIDAGTSSVKVCVFTLDGRPLVKAERITELVTPDSRAAEVDLEEYWGATVEALKEVAPRAGSVVGIGLSTTCPTTVLLDAEQRPLRPGILYLDRRATDQIDRVASALGASDHARVFERTGNRISPATCTVTTLTWLAANEPEVWSKVRTIGYLNTFLGARLTGAIGTDRTQASYSGIFSLTHPDRGWDPDLVAATGMPGDRLAPVLRPSDCLGTLTAAAAAVTGLPRGTPVAIGAADTAAATYALGLTEAGDAFESVGTSGVITYCLDRPEFEATFMHRCHVTDGGWLAHGAMSTLGGALAWLRHRVLPNVRSLAELEALAQESVPGSNGLVFLPYLAGERSPIWDADASGAWIGLRLGTTRADLVRSVFEGGAFALRQIIDIAEERWGVRPTVMPSVGGATRSRVWHQIKADIVGIGYRPASMSDASAFGAALLGAVAGGAFNGVLDPERPRLELEEGAITPRLDAARTAYERNYQVYRGLYPALQASMRALV